jgi:hypothetical protein
MDQGAVIDECESVWNYDYQDESEETEKLRENNAPLAFIQISLERN